MPASRILMWAFSSAVSTCVEIAAGLVERQAAQAVVAAEFDDDDLRVQQQN